MQSAFVDIGLDRDAFLYVSDFFEDNDEYDKIVTSVEEKVLKMEKGPAAVGTAPPRLPGRATAAVPSPRPRRLPKRPPPPLPRRQRVRPRRSTGAPEQFARAATTIAIATAAVAAAPGAAGPRAAACPNPSISRRAAQPGRPPPPVPEEAVEAEPEHAEAAAEDIVVLPGESLAKYRGSLAQTCSAASVEAPIEAPAEASLETAAPDVVPEPESVEEPALMEPEPEAAATPVKP